jgi:hypothetical protein
MSVAEFEAEGKRPPVQFSQAIADEICEALACGVPLAEVCGRPGFPSRRGVYGWRKGHQSFATAMDDARRFRADSRADVIDGLLQDMAAGRLDGVTGRAIIDGHKWLMSKENVRYSDVSKVEMSGPNGSAISILNAEPPEMRELARFLALVISNGDRAARQLELQATEALPALGGAHG